MANEMNNPLVRAQAQVKTACDKLGLEPEVYELLKEPKKMHRNLHPSSHG